MGPYCGQTSYPDQTVINLDLITVTNKLTVVIYYFALNNYSPIINWKVKSLDGIPFLNTINPCNTIAHYCKREDDFSN